MSQVIQVENISKSFGDKKALERINFHIDQGEIFGFLGPSGSGKTTLINILTGQLDADNGQSKILGKASDAINAQDLVKIGLVSDTSGFYEKMTLYKNLQIYAKLYDLKNERIDEVLEQVGLLESKNIVAEKLSTGMKQRMFLARALLNNPEVLFLDEPTSGLDPRTSKVIHELLLELKKKGTTIFLTTHDMHEASALCDRLALLNKGVLVEYGKPKAIIQKYNAAKKVKISYENGETEQISFSELATKDLKLAITVHSCEPTLEEIFIQLTGEKLDV
jgi:ABC transporter, ATP-binding protein